MAVVPRGGCEDLEAHGEPLELGLCGCPLGDPLAGGLSRGPPSPGLCPQALRPGLGAPLGPALPRTPWASSTPTPQHPWEMGWPYSRLIEWPLVHPLSRGVCLTWGDGKPRAGEALFQPFSTDRHRPPPVCH